MMDAIEKRARELLAAEFGCDPLEVSEFEVRAAQVILASQGAFTPPEGHVVVTRNEAGQAVAVTRQDDEGRILSVIADLEAPEGYVLVPVEPTMAMHNAAALSGLCGTPPTISEDGRITFRLADASAVYRAMLAARPEVKNVND